MEAQLHLAERKLKNKQILQKRNVSSKMQLLEAQVQRAVNADEARDNVGLVGGFNQFERIQ